MKTWLFGSWATGNARSFSDIDIALDAGRKPVSSDLPVRPSCALDERTAMGRLKIRLEESQKACKTLLDALNPENSRLRGVFARSCPIEAIK